jgi:membrane protease YdiL (CAAX protease family)
MGWIVLTVLLGLMFVLNLSSYLVRSPKKSSLSLYSYQESLQTSVKVRIMAERLGGQELKEGWVARLDPNEVRELRSGLRTSTDYAIFYAVARKESDEPIGDYELDILRDSKSTRDRAFFTLFRTGFVTDSALEAAEKQLDRTKFIDRLAFAQTEKRLGRADPYQNVFTMSELKNMLLALAAAGLGFFAGGLGLLFLIFTHRKLPGHPAGNLLAADADQYAIRAAQLLAAFLGVSLVIGGAARYLKLSETAAMAIEGAFVITSVILILRARLGRGQTGFAAVGITKENLSEHVFFGILGALANVPVVFAMAVLGATLFSGLPPAVHPIQTQLNGHTPAATLLVLLLLASVQAPLLEESMFRGALLPAFSSVLRSPIWAGIVSSCLFAVIHPTGIPAWPALAAIGGMSSYLSYRTKSLVPSLVMHAVHNGATVLFAVMIG